jgi:hypothetical protein
MAKAASNQPNLRYERKFVYTHLSAEDLIDTEVLCNGFGFREIFHRRTVNNLYLDDQNMSFYRQNVAGDEEREKFRIRWYGDDFQNVTNPTVEIKKKFGAVGDKVSFKYKSFTAQLNTVAADLFKTNIEKTAETHKDLKLASSLACLQPSLYNSYERRYFLSACELYRITVDYNMSFYNPAFSNFAVSKVALSDVVLELKYAVKDDKEARHLSQQLSSRLSKNSKYVRGVDLIHHKPHY